MGRDVPVVKEDCLGLIRRQEAAVLLGRQFAVEAGNRLDQIAGNIRHDQTAVQADDGSNEKSRGEGAHLADRDA